jgi:two-component system, OmpR family, phosphate regulon sensor histidine kinase PhoR
MMAHQSTAGLMDYFWDWLKPLWTPLAWGVALGAFAYAFNPWTAAALFIGGLVMAVLARHVFTPVSIKMQTSRRGGPVDPVSAVLPPLARAVIENLPAPVMLLDGGQRVLFANESMRGIVGTDVDGKHVSAVLRDPLVIEAIRETGHSGVAGAIEFTLPVPIQRFYQAYTARVSAEPPAVALLLHDVTSIRRSEQMRADFVANASHELRTPLAAVSGFIDTLRGHARDDEAARERFLAIMSTEAARMRRLIDDLLSLTRIELNEHVRPVTRVQLEGIVREAAQALEPLAAGDGITVRIIGAGPEGLTPITGDRDELVQLFQNLIHNAIKYGRLKGEVVVTLGHAGPGEVFVAIRDDGEGIPQTAIPRLTERFYRVDVKRSREKGGTGLGLAIVKHIVSRHHGRLAIESKPGEGSVFTVFLPEGRPESAPRQAPGLAVTEVL